MPDIKGVLSFNVGIESIMASVSEVGRQNLPDSARLLPGGSDTAVVYSRMLQGTLSDELKALLVPDIRNREVMMPEVFTAAIDKALEKAKAQAEATGSAAMANLAGTLAEIRGNQTLCDMFRDLLLPG